MSIILWIIVIVLALGLWTLIGLWLVVPPLTGLPWRPTEMGRARKALEMAHLGPGEVLYDLGSGDGRVLVLAAREFQAWGVGVELSPAHCLVSQISARLNRVADRVRIQRGDFYNVDLSEADVVFAYMTSAQTSRLKPRLEAQLHPGARVVTISFDLDGWEPQSVDRDELIFLYSMPPQPGSLETYLNKIF